MVDADDKMTELIAGVKVMFRERGHSIVILNVTLLLNKLPRHLPRTRNRFKRNKLA